LEYLATATATATISGSRINTDGYNWTKEHPEMLNLNSQALSGIFILITSIPMIWQWQIPLKKRIIGFMIKPLLLVFFYNLENLLMVHLVPIQKTTLPLCVWSCL
jgi:hypothetical protein